MINNTARPPDADTVNTWLFALLLVLIFILGLYNVCISH